MAYFKKEPAIKHDEVERIGILLINLGTPDAPTGKALKPYLKQFLSDRRVIEIPRAIWWFILNGIILNTRPSKSAEKYAMIWSDEGSPLLVHTHKQAILLQGFLTQRLDTPYAVEHGMRYGNPSVSSAIEKLKARNCSKIIVMPLYPQYAGSSTASALDSVWDALKTTRNVPAIRAIRDYHDHPAYIRALADNIQRYWMTHGRPDKLIMSFHGVPRFTIDKGDTYYDECQRTGKLLAEALSLEKDAFVIAFQSRFGRAEWLKPYLAPMLEELGKNKTKRIDVVCPGFVGDCLETLEEIAMEGKASFLQHGGGEYHYIPALNESEAWIHGICDILLENMHGWIKHKQPY